MSDGKIISERKKTVFSDVSTRLINAQTSQRRQFDIAAQPKLVGAESVFKPAVVSNPSESRLQGGIGSAVIFTGPCSDIQMSECHKY